VNVALQAPESPYKGLQPFEDTTIDALLFFGREQEREVIAANLMAARLTVLYGASGVGKSSVLNAGVVHDLRRLAREYREFVVASYSAWSEDEPIEGIAASVRDAVEDVLGFGVDEAPGSLAERIAAWSELLGGEIYLVLDQFEEFFLYHGGDGEGSLLDELPPLVTEPRLRAHVLLGIREDALARLDVFKARIPGLFANYLRLERLDATAARAAIEGPLKRWAELAGESVEIEPALVGAILAAVTAERIDGNGGAPSPAGSGIEPPYLQIVLERVWEAEREASSHVLRRTTLEELGGGRKIVGEHLDRALATLDPTQRDTAAAMFRHLVTPSGTKIAHGVADLASYARVEEANVRGVAATLMDQRILRPVEAPGDGGRVEIFHDVLGGAVSDWRRRHEAERALEAERRDARRRHRRSLIVIAVALVALLAMTAVAAYAVAQRNRADDEAAEAEEQAALALEQRGEAKRQEAAADRERKEAERLAQVASRQKDEAKRQAEIAQAQRAEAHRQEGIALDERAEAKRQAAFAEEQQREAQQQAAFAKEQRQEAQQQASIANRERSKAGKQAERAARGERKAERQAQIAEAAQQRASEHARAADVQRRRAGEQAERAARGERRARGRELEAEASALIPVAPVQVDPELGLLLAAEAARLSPSSRGADILRRALLVSHLRRVLPERRVTSASFSPVGNRLVVGTEGGIARLYATNSRRQLAALRVGRPVTGVSTSPDGRLALTTESGGPARLWNVGTRTVLRSFGRAPTAASFSSDGSLVLTVEPSGTRVWRASDGSAVAALRQPNPPRAASFAPGVNLVVTIGVGRVARVFEAVSGRLIAAVDHGGDLTSAAITPDGRSLITAGANRMARVWTLEGGSLVHELSGHRGRVTAAVVSPDGARLVTTSTDTTARVWALQSGELLTELDGHTNRVEGGAFSRDGLSVVTWSADGTARVWDLPSGADRVTLTGPGGTIASAAFDRSGNAVLTTSADARARIWSSRVADELSPLARVPAPTTAASFSGDGRIAVVAGRSGIAVLRAADARRIAQLPAFAISVLAVSRTGSLVAGASQRRISIWRGSTGEPVGTMEEDERVTAMALSPDARRVAVGTANGTVRIWTAAGRRAATFVAPGRVTSLAFSPSGDRIAAGVRDGTVAAWSVQAGRRLWHRPGHRKGTAVLSVAFSPSGRRIVSAGRDSNARVWHAATGRPSYVLSGHVATVSGAGFSPNGHWVVTAGPGAAGLWDLPTRQRLLFLRGHSGRLLAASFDAAGRRIATVGVDGTLRAYACDICGGIPELLRLAESRLAQTGRKLTPGERRRYFGG
jgi:WD40 repeat protein